MEVFAAGPTRVMGILNVTPDSFSDGGRWTDLDRAVAHGRELVAAGAAIVDVGGESTRPGAERPSAAEELRRVLPVVEALAAEGTVVSVDTMRADVAAAAVAAGAAIINDVSGGLADPEMLAAVAASGAGYVTMHWRGHSFGMYDQARYHDVVAEVCAELASRVEAALEAGIEPASLAIDPGFGFAKDYSHNWTLLAGLERVEALGYPVLVGVSRKGFLGRPGGLDARPTDRDAATVAVTALVAARRVWAVRTHEVFSQVAAISVAERIRAAGEQG
ncbi:dihydropteroate synthase [Propionicicella superfundia]|uniref:dihydropteroate synthase n=1 Tax=Propionicicella superfundia TaxID=348582 RepID=UPI0004917301|nr:dihydropteroate synthase [Propionicicella superfundia]